MLESAGVSIPLSSKSKTQGVERQKSRHAVLFKTKRQAQKDPQKPHGAMDPGFVRAGARASQHEMFCQSEKDVRSYLVVVSPLWRDLGRHPPSAGPHAPGFFSVR